MKISKIFIAAILFALIMCLLALRSDGAGRRGKTECHWQVHTHVIRNMDDMNTFLRLHPNCEPIMTLGDVIKFKCWVCEE